MKTVILCGGKGSRLVEMTDVIPKPMLPIGGKPIVHHIMDIYMQYGLNDFILPVGYKQEHIIAYFIGLNPVDITFSEHNRVFIFNDFTVTIVDTGKETQTGGRLLRIRDLLNAPFHFTYGDGVSNVDLHELTCQFTQKFSLATISLVHPEGRFGRAEVGNDGITITNFGEKIESDTDWINGGFSILDPAILDYIHSDETNLEKEVYPQLATNGILLGYKHYGFWKACDTKRDLLELEEIYKARGPIWLKEKIDE